MSETVAIRLTPKQISVIWQGLAFIVNAEGQRRSKGAAQYRYHRAYPPPGGFDMGAMHPEIMDQIIRFWRKLRPKKTRGGRVHLDLLEIRAAIFSVRVTLAIWRMRIRVLRKKAVEFRALVKNHALEEQLSKKLSEVRITRERYYALREQAAAEREKEAKQYAERPRRYALSTILSLERHMKRAKRRLLANLGQAEYANLTQSWRQHLRWMRLHLVYFKPLPPIVMQKRTKQRQLDMLAEMAIAGLRYLGYAPPDARELRHALRLYVRSSVLGREGKNSVHEMMKYPKDFTNKWFLAVWVISRVTKRGIELKRLDEK